jgi:hypothetical protein
MVRKAWLQAAVCSVLLVSFAGCPGASVVGAWKMVIDEDCSTMNPPVLLLLLYQGGTFEIPDGGFMVVTGTWSSSGGEISLVNDVAGNTGFVTFIGTFSRGFMEGTYSGDTDGCWTAERIAF